MKEVTFLTSRGFITAVSAYPAQRTVGGAFSKMEAQGIVRELRRAIDRRSLLALYELASGLSPYAPYRLSDADLVGPIERAIETGRLLFAKGLSSFGRRTEDDAGRMNSPVNLARSIMGAEGQIIFEGRRYRLVAGTSYGPRDGFCPMAARDAVSLIGRMAQELPETPEQSARWAEVLRLFSKGGSTPSLALLRFTPTGGSSVTRNQPVSTPSQLVQVAAVDWIELQIVYEDGTAVSDTCTVTLPGGRDVKGPPDASGIIRLDGLTPGSCGVSFPTLAASFPASS